MKSMIPALVLWFVFGLSAHAAGPVRPVIIQGVDIFTWPPEMTADKVLSIYIELMQKDETALAVLHQVNSKLKSHGIEQLRDIFAYCEGEPPAENATAFFSQGSRIEVKVKIPGAQENPWSAEVLQAKQTGFSAKEFSTPFIDFLIIQEKPKICIHKDNQVYKAYGSVLHEMTHFLLKDPFQYFDDVLVSRRVPDYIQSTVNEPGGELDAFKVGTAAGLRLIRAYQIPGLSGRDHRFFNADGLLVDENGLRAYLLEIYSDFIGKTGGVERFKMSSLILVDTQLKILKEGIGPWIKQHQRTDLEELLTSEILALEALRSSIQGP